jgi:hypothetical protein
MYHIRALGPIVKLMRWYSWFQCERYYSGECWGLRLIMLQGRENCSPNNCCQFVRQEESISLPTSGLTDKQELRQLKMKHGTWALAPLLVTPASMFQKDLIKLLAQPSWTHHSGRAEKILTPQQVAQFTIEKCQGGWVDELYDLVIQGFLTPDVLKELYPHQDTSKNTKLHRLGIHFDFLCKLVAKRSMSLVAQYLRPPVRYCAMLCAEPGAAATSKDAMQDAWEVLLDLEGRDAKGEHIPGLDAMHFLKESITRVCFLLNERDLKCHGSLASVIMRALILHLGCTSCIENTHQSAKNTLRQARHNQRSRVHKYKACMDAKILQSRQVPHVSINELELAVASVKSLPRVIPLTNPNSHKMSREFQLMMQHKGGAHFWPSTSAQTQFEEAMAFEFLMNNAIHQTLCSFPAWWGAQGQCWLMKGQHNLIWF